MIYKAKYILAEVDRVLEDGEVLVLDGEIRAVGRDLKSSWPDEAVTDLGDCVILPGFVNAHSHIEATLSRNRWDGLNLWDWLEKLAFHKDRAPSAEAIRASAMVGAAECAASGITCLGDCAYSGIAAEAMEAAGVRGVVYREVFGQSMGDAYKEKFARFLDSVGQMRAGLSSRIEMGISPHSVYTSSPDVLKLTNEKCAELRMPVAIHLAETLGEEDYTLTGSGPLADWRARLGYPAMVSGKRPVAHLEAAGLVRKGVCLAHCVHLLPDEIELVASSGAGVAHCPRSNAFLGSGVAPLVGLTAASDRIGVGTDSAGSCMRLDFFEELRYAMGLARAVGEDAGIITAKDIVKLATIGGARALGLADRIGTLELGKRADFIAIDLSDHLAEENLYLSIVSGSGSEVVLSVVDGREVVRDGKPVRVDAAEWRARLKSVTEQAGVG